MKRTAVIGGDERALRLALLLEKKGYTVNTLGLRQEEEPCPVEEAELLLFAYPYSSPGGMVPNLRGLSIELDTVLARAKPGTCALLGEDWRNRLPSREWEEKGLRLLAYSQDEGFLQTNTDISAEGALCYAMKQLPCTISGCTHLVAGYGRFGRALALKLHALGGRVKVAARSEKAREQAREDGLEAISLEELPDALRRTRVFLNTVAAQVLGKDALRAVSKDALLMELASAPYGFDREEAEAMGLAVAFLPGIPGRYAPESAAQALYDAMIRLTGGMSA
ncbi:MAG: dipicolinate synthase subunit DpsA [Candidatus Limiplasma sp.]|nr:dipicolinate synthase subunit DpsA [Candidatus Limiplasma sp.]